MNKRAILLSGLSLCWLAVPGDEDLGLRVEPGQVRTKTFVERTRWTLMSMEQAMGEVVISGVTVDMGAELARRLVVSDEVLAAAHRRPTRQPRTLEEGRLEVAADVDTGGPSESYALEFSSPLEDEPLLLEWDADQEEWSVGFDRDAEGDESLLEGLGWDADLLALLGDEILEEGDAWEIEAEDLRSVLMPGGDWHMLPDDFPEGPYDVLTPTDILAVSLGNHGEHPDELDGLCELRWIETRDSEGGELAVLSLEIELEVTADHSERMAELRELVDWDDQRRDVLMHIAWVLEGKGEVVWNLDQGRLESFRLPAEMQASMEMSWIQAQGSEEVETEVLVEIEGETVLEARVEEE